MSAKYKDAQGRYRTLSLFHETITATARESGYTPVFTLKDECSSGLPSLKRAFIESEDPTGYACAMQELGSWDHWVKLQGNQIIREQIDSWQPELEVAMRSKAIANIYCTALDGGPQGMAAAKFIADKGWDIKRGRPSKSEMARTKREDAAVRRELENDSDRILKVVGSKK